MEELGGRGLSDEDVKALFKAADLKGTKLIEFREFLICVALGIYLKQDMEIEKAKAQFGEKYAQNLKGFRVVLDAFRKVSSAVSVAAQSVSAYCVVVSTMCASSPDHAVMMLRSIKMVAVH